MEEWGGLVDLVEAQLMRGVGGIDTEGAVTCREDVWGASQPGEPGYAGGGLGAAATLVQRRQSSLGWIGVAGGSQSPGSSQCEGSGGCMFVERKGRGGGPGKGGREVDVSQGRDQQGKGGSRRGSILIQPSQSLFGVVSLGAMEEGEGVRDRTRSNGGGKEGLAIMAEEAGDEMFVEGEAGECKQRDAFKKSCACCIL